VAPLLHVVLLRQRSMHERIRRRVEFTERQLRDAGVSCEVVDVEGRTVLGQMLRAVQLGDFVSYYVGLLNDVDPSPVEALDELKSLMAAR
jgi:glucose/mannose-6-phosphate isomerase